MLRCLLVPFLSPSALSALVRQGQGAFRTCSAPPMLAAAPAAAHLRAVAAGAACRPRARACRRSAPRRAGVARCSMTSITQLEAGAQEPLPGLSREVRSRRSALLAGAG